MRIIATNSTKETCVGKQVFINLPVANLSKSVAFFKALVGKVFDFEQFK